MNILFALICRQVPAFRDICAIGDHLGMFLGLEESASKSTAFDWFFKHGNFVYRCVKATVLSSLKFRD